MKYQHLRHATAKLNYAGTTFLIDPMLSPKDTYPGFPGTKNSETKNPMTNLPISIDEILNGVDAILVTHTHLDHWDDEAQKQIPKHLPIIVQNENDAQIIKSQGFENIQIINDNFTFNGIKLTKTGGQHGTDEMYAIPQLAEFLGEAMGVIFQNDNEKTLYIAGDTLWRKEVADSITQFSPDVIVLNLGYAELENFTGAVTMGTEDLINVAKASPNSQIIAVHMETANHCLLTRKDVADFSQEKGINDRVLIPNDGKILTL